MSELLELAAEDLSSPVPFYAALLQPALAWVLPAGEQGQRLVEGLAEELAPVVEQVRWLCWHCCACAAVVPASCACCCAACTGRPAVRCALRYWSAVRSC